MFCVFLIIWLGHLNICKLFQVSVMEGINFEKKLKSSILSMTFDLVIYTRHTTA